MQMPVQPRRMRRTVRRGSERSAGGFDGATTRIRIYLDVFRRGDVAALQSN